MEARQSVGPIYTRCLRLLSATLPQPASPDAGQVNVAVDSDASLEKDLVVCAMDAVG